MKYKNPGTQKFQGKMIDAGGGGVFVLVPFDVEKLYGTKARIPVDIVFDNKIKYKGSMVNMGEGHCVIVLKSIREKLDKKPGDFIDIEIKLDDKPRTVIIPDLFKAELEKHPEAKKYFDSLSYTHQKEYVNYVIEGKKEETRLRRMNKVIAMLTEKTHM